MPKSSKIESLDKRENSGPPADRQALLGALGAAVHAYQRSTQALDRAIGAHLGLGDTDLRCLDWLVDGPKTPGELARGVGLSSAATTTLVDRLEARGLVERARDPTDRRRVRVSMSPACARAAGELYGPIAAEGTAALSTFSDAELATIVDFLIRSREVNERHRDLVAARPARSGD